MYEVGRGPRLGATWKYVDPCLCTVRARREPWALKHLRVLSLANLGPFSHPGVGLNLIFFTSVVILDKALTSLCLTLILSKMACLCKFMSKRNHALLHY